MSEGAILILGLVGLAFTGLILFAVLDREGFREFFRTIEVFEFGPKGLRVTRAVAEAKKAVEEKEHPKSIEMTVLRNEFSQLPRSAAILWIDDNPGYNVHEAAAFRHIGLKVDQVTSNEAAQRALRAGSYDLVISDIRRDNEDETAGLRVPELLQSSRDPETPLLYYVGKAEAGVTSEGYPVTDRPSELFAQAQRALTTARG